MNDRFKFRAWHKEKQEMYNVDGLYAYDSEYTEGGEVFFKEDSSPKNSYYFPEEVELMQCTGLKDKNGTLIYEGDIISDKSNHIRVCVWEYDGFKYPALKTSRYFHKPISNKLEERKINLRKNLTFQDNVYKCDKKEFVVIGNIYENKELLND